MDYKPFSIKKGAAQTAARDQRCKRPKNIMPVMVAFDLEDRRLVATFGWIDIQVVHDPNRLQISARPTVLFLTMSYN